jgi:hypothetical protein
MPSSAAADTPLRTTPCSSRRRGRSDGWARYSRRAARCA